MCIVNQKAPHSAFFKEMSCSNLAGSELHNRLTMGHMLSDLRGKQHYPDRVHVSHNPVVFSLWGNITQASEIER